MNTCAAILQLLVAVAFLSIPLVRHRYGADAKATAEAELERQGVPAGVLEANGLRFDAGGHETYAPLAVAAVMATLAGLNLTGNSWAEPLTWAFQSIVILGNVLILHSQLTAATAVTTAFERKGDPVLKRIDVPALLKAAENAFPAWVGALQNLRHTVVFAASALALTAVAL
ncbi:hypothetical protein [Streptomyces sp. NPDC002054]|uniref:hypothetical protein n=1 Tax=Streptomyces sp. NPDC002054 TaxID=3154663 RepID=UPI0033213095